MKKILYIAFATSMLAGTAALTSCSDFLDADNKTNISAIDFFPTAEGMTGLRNYTYSLLNPIITETDIYEWGTDLYVPTRGGDGGEFNRYDLTPQSSSVSSFYTNLYALINSANCMLYYAGEEDGRAIAEAKFFRNYAYYLLTQHFGSVPYITEYIQGAERNYPKTPLSELYPKIIEELESIMNDSNLPAESSGANLGYISQRAVKALLAKVCLAAGWDLGTTLTNAEQGTYSVNDTQYFTKAAQYAEAAINNQALTMSFEEKWSPANETNNPEIIFSAQYERAGNPGILSDDGHGLQNTFGSYYGVCTTNGMKYCNSGKAVSAKGIYLWEPGDERFDGTFMNTIYNFDGTWGTSGYYAYYNNSGNRDKMNIAYRYLPYYVTTEEAEAEFTANKSRYSSTGYVNSVFAYILGDPVTQYTFNSDGTFKKTTLSYAASLAAINGTTVCKKWDDPNTVQENTNTTNGYRDVVLFHVSDMYLTAAEAYLMAGQTDKALSYVNAVRTRANAGTLSSFAAYQPAYSIPASFGSITDLDVILDEKGREEFGENERWMDLRRTRQLVRYNIAFNDYVTSASNMSNAQGEIKWYRPIPAQEMANNTALTEDDQNPGY